jgi:GNAT superfamily N-acetyltransferase
MGRIQEKITASILRRIRARRTVPALDSPSASSGGLAPAAIREASFSDFNAVMLLKQRWGLVADCFENWERLWRRNPALMPLNCDRPIGWVLEADGVVVGYMGNISLQYRYGERTLNAVTSHGLVVEPGYRSAGISLVAAFNRQKSVDLYLTTTAIPAVGKIAKLFKFDALPQAEYESVLFWILKPRTFAREIMKKLELKPALARTGSAAASLAIRVDKLMRGRWPRQHSTELAVSEIGINEIKEKEEEFQSLWMDKVSADPRLFADRSSAALRWHFEVPGDRGAARALCCRRHGKLIGYAVVRHDPQPNGVQKSLVADILAKQDDPEVLRALLTAAYDDAKSAGSYILEVLGLPPNVRSEFLQWNPYVRKYPASPFYYKAADPALHKALSYGKAWYATPFDGDTTLIRPSFSRPDPSLGSSAVQIKTMLNNVATDVHEPLRSDVF